MNEFLLSLTYDDIALVNRVVSTSQSRFTADTMSLDLLKFPLIASPMDTVCEEQMASELNCYGMVGILHRFCTTERQCEMLKKVLDVTKNSTTPNNVGVAIGISGDYQERLNKLIEAFVTHNATAEWTLWVCLDVANGFSTLMAEAVNYALATLVNSGIRYVTMAGNVASREGVKFLDDLGVDVIRLGIGNGSPCTTSKVTGFGQGIVSVIREAYDYKPQAKLLADGGIRSAGDIAKALACGADAVMVGSLLAGFDESPGEVIYSGKDPLSGKSYKIFRGMASYEAAKELQDSTGIAKKIIPEGVSHKVPYKGAVAPFLEKLIDEFKISLSFVGASDIHQFKRYFEQTPNTIVQLTPNSYRERGAYIKENGL